MGMPPFMQALIGQVAKAPGFQETLDRVNQFISTVDIRLASIQAKQEEILAALKKGENDGR